MDINLYKLYTFIIYIFIFIFIIYICIKYKHNNVAAVVIYKICTEHVYHDSEQFNH